MPVYVRGPIPVKKLQESSNKCSRLLEASLKRLPQSRNFDCGRLTEMERRKIQDEVLARRVDGVNLKGRVLQEELSDRLTLMVFLRHLG